MPATPEDVPEITVPVVELGEREMWPGFFQVMLELGDVGRVASQAGLGGDGIFVTWKGRHFIVSGLDIIRAVATAVDPEDAGRIPG